MCHVQVSLFIYGRYVPSLWTKNPEFTDKKSTFDYKIVIFDYKIVIFDQFCQCEQANSQIKSITRAACIFGQAYCTISKWWLGSSQFTILPQQPQKMMRASFFQKSSKVTQ